MRTRDCKSYKLPSKEYLHQIFHYDSEVGDLTWKRTAKTSRSKPGDVAGYLFTNNRGLTYRMVGLNGKYYMAAHIIARMYLGLEEGQHVRYVGIDQLDTRLKNLIVTDNPSLAGAA